MYLRIMNRLDAMMLKKSKKQCSPDKVLDRILEITSSLENNYGSHRKSNDYGGFVLFFNDSEEYTATSDAIFDFYHIDSELYEYSDEIANEGNLLWKERLYLLSSEDSLVFVYPEVARNV